MILETASTFVSSITALSSVVKAAKAAKQLTDDAVKISDAIAKKLEPENDSVKSLKSTTIDSELIEIATENIDRARKRLIKSLRDPALPQAGKDEEVEVAGFTICSELRRLKALNGGLLPGSDRFHELWISHSCEQVA